MSISLIIFCDFKKKKLFDFLQKEYSVYFVSNFKKDLNKIEDIKNSVVIVWENDNINITLDLLKYLKSKNLERKIILIVDKKDRVLNYLQYFNIEIFLSDIPIENIKYYIKKIKKTEDETILYDSIFDIVIQAFDLFFHLFSELEFSYLNDIPCIFLLHNKDGKIIKINNYAKRILGNVEGMSSWSIYSSSLIGINESPVIVCLQNGELIKTKETLISKDGTMRNVLSVAVPVNILGEIRYVVEICLDIYELTRIYNELIASELRFQHLFQDVPWYIQIINKRYKVISINKKIVQDFDFKTGNYCYSLYGKNSKCIDCPVKEIEKHGQPTSFEQDICDKNGTNKNTLVWLVPIKDMSGNIKEFMEILTDITEVKNMQKHLADLGILISSVSHEIKNMFTGLDGHLYRLNKAIGQNDMDSIKVSNKRLNHILSRIKRLVVDILDYAKQKKLELNKVSIKLLAEYIEEIVRPKLDTYNIEFSIVVLKKDFYLYIDEQKFLSALINVIDNAIDACILDKEKSSHKIQLSIRRVKNKAIFTVTDNGIGMDDEVKKHLFEPFFSSKGPRGIGLGLFITKDIIEKHKGKIKISSYPGKGTRLIIELPIYYFSTET